jgi:hypothetical protein
MNGNNSLAHGWWRWPLLPFAALIGAMLGSALFMAFQWLAMKFRGDFNEDGWYFLYIMPVIQSAIFGWLYVLITYKIAPQGKFIAGIVMTTILILLSLCMIAFAWFGPYHITKEAVRATVGLIAMSIAAVISLIAARDEYGE